MTKTIILFLSFLTLLNPGIASERPLNKIKKRDRKETTFELIDNFSVLPKDLMILIFHKLIDERKIFEIHQDLDSLAQVNRKCRSAVFLLDEMRWNKLFVQAKEGNQQMDLMHLAAHKGKLQIVKKLTEMDKSLLGRTKSCNTSAFLAAARGHVDIIEFIGKNASDSFYVRCGNLMYTPAQIAAQNGYAQVIKVINLYCPETLGDVTFYARQNLYEIAIECGQLKVFEMLFNTIPDIFNILSDGRRNAAHIIADSYISFRKGENLLEMLKIIACFAPEMFFKKDLSGYNPAFIAAKRNNIRVFKLLSSLVPASLNETDQYNRSIAHFSSNSEIIEILGQLALESLRAIDTLGRNSSMHVAAYNTDINNFKILMKYVPEILNVRNRYGESPLDILHFNLACNKYTDNKAKISEIQDFLKEFNLNTSINI